MSAALRDDVKNLRAWLHRIEEACATASGPEVLQEIRDAALYALCGSAAPGGPGFAIKPTGPVPDVNADTDNTTAEALPLAIVIIPGDGGFTVKRGDRSAVGLCWDEMLGQVVNLTQPNGGGRLYAMQTDHERDAERRRHEERLASNAARRRAVVTVEYPIEDARRLDASLADILCWAAGFRAARPDDTSTYPMGVEAVREIRGVLTRAIAQAE